MKIVKNFFVAAIAATAVGLTAAPAVALGPAAIAGIALGSLFVLNSAGQGGQGRYGNGHGFGPNQGYYNGTGNRFNAYGGQPFHNQGFRQQGFYGQPYPNRGFYNRGFQGQGFYGQPFQNQGFRGRGYAQPVYGQGYNRGFGPR